MQFDLDSDDDNGEVGPASPTRDVFEVLVHVRLCLPPFLLQVASCYPLASLRSTISAFEAAMVLLFSLAPFLSWFLCLCFSL